MGLQPDVDKKRATAQHELALAAINESNNGFTVSVLSVCSCSHCSCHLPTQSFTQWVIALAGQTWNSSSEQLLQVVPEQQLVPGDLEPRSKEQGPPNAVEHLIWQCVFAGSASLCPHCLQNSPQLKASDYA